MQTLFINAKLDEKAISKKIEKIEREIYMYIIFVYAGGCLRCIVFVKSLMH